MAANTSTTDKRLDDLREDMKDMRADIRQIRNWLFAEASPLSPHS